MEAISAFRKIYLQLRHTDETITYGLSSHVLKPCNIVQNLGITVQMHLKLGLHCIEIAYKAKACYKLKLKSFLSYDPTNLTHAFITYVRLILEYYLPVWSPYYISDIDTNENIQRTLTCKLYWLCCLKVVLYGERLKFLSLQKLEVRRIYIDFIFMYTLKHNIVSSVCLKSIVHYSTYTSTRGHRYKMFIARTHKLVLSTFFCNRVAPIWNALPNTCFTMDRMNVFKNKLHNVDLIQFCKRR